MEPQGTQPPSNPNEQNTYPNSAAPDQAAPAAPAPGASVAPDQSAPVVVASTDPSTPAPAASYPSPQPTVGAPMPSMPPVPEPKRSKRWVLPVALAVAAVVLAGGYTFAFYLPNRPSAIYKSSLHRTGDAIDALTHYSNGLVQKHYKSYGVNGSMHVKSGSSSFDATLTGNADARANASMKLDANILGQKIAADLRTVEVANSANPDLYLRLTGIKSALDSYGLNSLDSLDGQWLSMDHSLLNTYATSVSHNVAGADATSMPTGTQVNDALTKVQTVNKQYLFTTDSSRAVLQNKKYVGKETQDGRAVYHYVVGYDKTHMQAYADALGKALDSSSLNNWSKSSNSGKNLSEVANISSLKQSISNAKDDYTFDVWVDAKTKLVHSVRFADPTDASSVLTFSQNYTGGSTYPFALSLKGKTSSGAAETVDLKVSLDTASNKQTDTLAITEGDTQANFDFTLTPSMDAVQVAAPAGSRSVADVLNSLGLGSL